VVGVGAFLDLHVVVGLEGARAVDPGAEQVQFEALVREPLDALHALHRHLSLLDLEVLEVDFVVLDVGGFLGS